MDEKKYDISFHGIDIIEKSLVQTVIGPNQVFNFDLTVNSSVNAEQELIIVFVLVGIRKADEKTNIGTLHIGCAFKMNNFKKEVKPGIKTPYIISSGIEPMLRTTAISTMRGILFSEFRGTQLHTAILPIILEDSLKPIAQRK